jgi:hypothetical protein
VWAGEEEWARGDPTPPPTPRPLPRTLRRGLLTLRGVHKDWAGVNCLTNPAPNFYDSMVRTRLSM